ncbi:type II secretion system protein N [Flocculibacter collagenilyticus]|uniref:type II secretion system protein N n=1 Tax=Flocculibacter collagenilyticus TaxID=2744479 RepID=UPI0018F35F82|nr:type II secretion system protein N [Flocculibacter collagenilyticus]
MSEAVSQPSSNNKVSTKSLIYIGVVFLFLYCFFLIINLPAAWVVEQAKQRNMLPPNVNISAPTGTIWQGEAQYMRIANINLNKVKWELSATQLLLGNIDANIKVDNSRQAQSLSMSGNIHLPIAALSPAQTNHAPDSGNPAEASKNIITLDDFKLRAPANQIAHYLTLPIDANLQGRFLIDIAQAELDITASNALRCELMQGDIVWQNANANVYGQFINLNAMDASLSCAERNVTMAFNPNNKLGLDAVVKLVDNNQITINGVMKPDASLPKSVHDAMQYLGKPNQQGQYTVEW